MTKDKIAYIRLDDTAEAAVAEKMNLTGLDQSKAIRIIIREWAEMKKQYITIPKVGIVKGENGVIAMNQEYWNSPEGIEQSR